MDSSVNDTFYNDSPLDICIRGYLKEFIRQGNNISLLNEDHVYGCCNGTFVNECAIRKDPEEHFNVFRYITEGVILTLIATFGFIGNTMSVIVLTRTATGLSGGLSSGTSFSNLLRGLAAFDALFLLSAILSFGLPNISSWYTTNVFLGGLCIMRVLFGLIHTFRIGSVYMTLAVTFERFHAIIFPLRHFSWKKYLIPTSVAIAVFYNIPKYFELEITVNKKNQTVISNTELRQNTIYVNLYVVWSKIIFIEIIPYFAIVIMNIFIITKITKSTRFRRKFQRQYPDPENTVGTATTMTTIPRNGRRIMKTVSSPCSNAGKKGESNAEFHVQPPNSQIKYFERPVKKETPSQGEDQPFLIRPKPSIEIESPTHSDHNGRSNVEILAEPEDRLAAKLLVKCKNSSTSTSTKEPVKQEDATCWNDKNSIEIRGPSKDCSSCVQSTSRSQSEPKDVLRNKTQKKQPPVQKKHFLRKQQEEHSLGIILILMSILFVICQSLKIVPDMYEIIVCNSAEHENTSQACEFPDVIQKLTELSHLLVCINSSANFLIYYCAGGKFREAWLDTYGFWWCCCSRSDLKSLIRIPCKKRNQSPVSNNSTLEAIHTRRSTMQNIRLSPMTNPSRNNSLFANSIDGENHSDLNPSSANKKERSNTSTKISVPSEV